MRNTFFVLGVVFFTTTASCKKEKPSVQISVVDQITNSPVSGAYVIVYKCGVFNCNLGSIDLFTGVTGNDGVCKVPVDSYNEAIYARVEKTGYWSWDDAKTTSKKIVPAGWILIRIVKTANYPAQSRLRFMITSQSVNSSGLALSFMKDFNAAADSSILIEVFGGQANKIEWEVQGPNGLLGGGNTDLQVPRLDTLKNIQLNY